MRIGIILKHRPLSLALSILLGASLLYPMAFLAPGYAERVAPQLEMSADPEAEVEPFTTVEEIEPGGGVTADGFRQMNLAVPTHPVAMQVEDEPKVPTLRGGVDIEREFVPDVVFDDVHTVAKGEKLVLIIMDLIATGYSQHGDQFNARLKFPVERDGKVLIPKGALVKGHILTSEEPGKALSKNGRVTLAFDYILMPDGRKVPFKSEYAKGDNALKAIGRAIGGGVGGTISGAIQGVLLGLKFGGIAGASMTNGATLIGGGGLGALAGLGQGLSQSGEHILLNEGDEIKVALQDPLELPSMIVPPDTQNEIHAEGLNVKITEYDLGRDPFKVEKQINLTIEVNNQTNYTFGSFDMVLMDEYNNTYFLSPFGTDSLLAFQIRPQSQVSGKLAFSVQTPEVRHYLIFYKPYTREVIAKISLTEAIKNLSDNKARSKSSRRS